MTRMSDLLQQLHELNRITAYEADNAKRQFTDLCAKAQSVHKKKLQEFNREQRLDVFYAELLAGNENMQDLWKVVKMVLTLSHGNASVEGGFLSTKSC